MAADSIRRKHHEQQVYMGRHCACGGGRRNAGSGIRPGAANRHCGEPEQLFGNGASGFGAYAKVPSSAFVSRHGDHIRRHHRDY
jgi:hypothetical protein